MSERGMMITVLATELANAVRADDANPAGHDIGAGLFGPAVSAWIRKTADSFIEFSTGSASAEHHQAPAVKCCRSYCPGPAGCLIPHNCGLFNPTSPYAGYIHENVAPAITEMPETAIGADLDKVAAMSAIPTLVRIRTLCEPCKASGGVVMRGAIMRCGACGGWGYVDESDADFRARFMEFIGQAGKRMRDEARDSLVPTAELDTRFTLIAKEVPAIACEHGEYLTCINCDTAHSMPEGSA